MDGRAGIDAALVRRLIEAQFPQWAALPIRPVEVDGWDNRTYRLGDTMSVRLPTAPGYVPAVAKENEWLPRLAPHLPVPIPSVRGAGVPSAEYPYPWSVRDWLSGTTAMATPPADLPRFAEQVAAFLLALQRCPADGGPPAGAHSWHRGAPPAFYDDETRACLRTLKGHIDTDRAAAVWADALAADFTGTPVWFHGDIASGNLLVRDGALAAVIDFGTSGVGDPACDLVITWTFFAGESRRAFRAAVGHDEGAWARARGWVLWKAMLVLTEVIDTDPREATDLHRLITDVLADA
ncbi:aminoglycoside phosphotransferase family protein [Catenuloplanes japonicus]|uniref:aminoglycoside phosphotransferase family protein n=1 Tax=Catenuloplanes japonicus TaxID=33876 RepID=UPI000B29B061|nr:aminoglycoside phosphotransferase family protein [Catenuloplanes japonicus]